MIALNVDERTTATDSGDTTTQGIVFVLDVRRTVVPNVDRLELVVEIPLQARGLRREAGGKNSREEGDVAFDVGVDRLATGGQKLVRWTVGSVLDDRLEAYPTCRDGVPVTDRG